MRQRLQRVVPVIADTDTVLHFVGDDWRAQMRVLARVLATAPG